MRSEHVPMLQVQEIPLIKIMFNVPPITSGTGEN
jgi:hypothetical protein